MLPHFSLHGGCLLMDNLSLPIVNHCVNACVSCSTFSPVCAPYFVSPEVIKRDLAMLVKVVRVKFLAIIGGEPLLHPDLLKIVDIATASGIAETVQIITNGQLLSSMPDELWSKPVAFVVTRYPGKFTDEQFSKLEQKAARCGRPFTVTNPLFNQFCKGITKTRLTDSEALCSFSGCGAKGWAVILIDGRFYWCHEFYYRHLLGLESWNGGLDIYNATLQVLIDYVSPTAPAPTCYNCTGYFTRTQPWQECRDPAEWYRRSTNE